VSHQVDHGILGYLPNIHDFDRVFDDVSPAEVNSRQRAERQGAKLLINRRFVDSDTMFGQVFAFQIFGFGVTHVDNSKGVTLLLRQAKI
jgi:hypothetical protein